MRKKPVKVNWEIVEKFFMENMDTMSTREIAKKYDITPDTLSKHMRGKGVSRFNRKPWTKREETFIEKFYPLYGSVYCSEKLKRSRESVSKKASELQALYVPQDSYVMTNGYRIVGKSDNRKLQHRIVMEKKIGRKLTSEEIVHHKDENKLNNHPDNLEIMTRAEHIKHHQPHRNSPVIRKRITRKG